MPASRNLEHRSALAIVSFPFKVAVFSRRYFLVVLHDDFFVSLMINPFNLPINIYKHATKNDVFTLNHWLSNSQMFVILVHVYIVNARARKLKHTFPIICSKPNFLKIMSPLAIVDGVHVITSYLDGGMLNLFRNNLELIGH